MAVSEGDAGRRLNLLPLSPTWGLLIRTMAQHRHHCSHFGSRYTLGLLRLRKPFLGHQALPAAPLAITSSPPLPTVPRLARAAAATPLFDRKPDHAEKRPPPSPPSRPPAPLDLYLTVWPSGLRRWLQAPVRKGVGSNPTAVICANPASLQPRARSQRNAREQSII